MSDLPGPGRRDLVAWAAALVAAAIGTVIARASGARLGTALTVGVILLVAVIVASLAFERRSGDDR